MKIQTSGTELTKEQKAVLTNLIAGYQFADHTRLLEINFKTYEVEGKREKWDVHAKARTDFGFFTAEGVAWKLNLAVKGALRKLEEQVGEAKTKGMKHGAPRPIEIK